VDDAHRVCAGECVGRLGAQQAGAFRVHRAVGLDDLAERAALEQLHGDVVDVARGVDLVDGDDVRVLEGRRGPRLADQLLDRILLLAAPHVLRQHLQGHLSAQVDVFGPDHAPHAAAADLGQEPEPADAFSDPGRD